MGVSIHPLAVVAPGAELGADVTIGPFCQVGPDVVLVTSVERPDRPADTIEMLAVTGDGAWIVQTPHIPMKANGSGDVTAALFTAHYRASGDAAAALAKTVSSVWDLLQTTYESGQRELQRAQ